MYWRKHMGGLTLFRQHWSRILILEQNPKPSTYCWENCVHVSQQNIKESQGQLAWGVSRCILFQQSSCCKSIPTAFWMGFLNSLQVLCLGWGWGGRPEVINELAHRSITCIVMGAGAGFISWDVWEREGSVEGSLLQWLSPEIEYLRAAV